MDCHYNHKTHKSNNVQRSDGNLSSNFVVEKEPKGRMTDRDVLKPNGRGCTRLGNFISQVIYM